VSLQSSNLARGVVCAFCSLAFFQDNEGMSGNWRDIRLGRAAWIKVVLVALALLAIFWISRYIDLQQRTREVLYWIDELGFWAPVFYVLTAVFVSMFFGPTWLVTISAGVIFEFTHGLLLAWGGTALGALGAFVLGRYLIRDWVARQIARSPRLVAIDRAVEKGGWKVAFLVRLLPMIPFNVINYSLSITRIPARIYIVTLLIGILPGVLANVIVGWMIGDLAGLDGPPGGRPLWQWVMAGFGLLCAVLFVSVIVRLIRREIRDQTLQAELS
jgi:uncharacterized membrane protein YdjX (TVP38/TMEM64 family)